MTRLHPAGIVRNVNGRFFILVGIIAAATLGAVVYVNHTFDDPPDDDIEGWIRSWLGVNLKIRAEKEMQRLVERAPTNPTSHYRWITLHFSRPERTMGEARDDKEIRAYYERLAEDADPRLADLGRYGCGLIFSSGDEDCERALDRFAEVTDRNLPYLNNSTGHCLQRLGRPAEATAYFEREIELGSNVGGASRNLAENLLELRDRPGLAHRIDTDPEFRAHMSVRLLRRLALLEGRIAEYLGLVVRGHLDRATTAGAVAAGLILAVWFTFLIRIDVFEPEAPAAISATLLMGMVVAVLCSVPYDLVALCFGAGLNGSPLNDLLYCIFGVGLIEETVKIVPLLVVLRWTNWADEPVDVAVYASASALGFAFVENLLSFHPMGLASVHGRAFTATVMHMSLSTLASYGILVAKRRKWPLTRAATRIAAFFGVAVVVHGVYDFFLVGRGLVADLKIAALAILVFTVIAYQRAVTNGLSGSPYWDETTDRKVINLWWYLGLALSGVVLVEYLLLAWSFGPTAAGIGFLAAAMSAWFLILILASRLGRFEITRYRWLSLVDRRDFQGRRKNRKNPS